MALDGAGLDSVRRSNLSVMLRFVHLNGPASRSLLTSHTGLNRSTVAGLVAELVRLGLVTEGDPESTNRVGRPSPLVVPDHRPVAIAVNPEFDAISVAAVGLGARVEHRTRHELDHPARPEEVARIVAGIVTEYREGPLRRSSLLGVGLAVPGLVSRDGLVRWAPHLDWRDVPIAGLVSDASGLPAWAANDASLGALAEHLFGVGRGVDDLVYLNGGASGIGGGVIASGALLGGAAGLAGEFGQSRVDGAVVEEVVNRRRLLDAVGLSGADEREFEETLLSAAAPEVAVELDRQQDALAGALATAVNVLNPRLLVLGGFLTAILRHDQERLEGQVAVTAVPAAWEGVELRAAALGADRLMIGAAELVFDALFDDPIRAVSR